MSRKFCPPLLLVFVAVEVVVVIAAGAVLAAGEPFVMVTPPAGTARFEILPPPPPDPSCLPVATLCCCCWTIWSTLTTVVGIMDNIVPSVLRVQSFGDSSGIIVTEFSTSRISGEEEEDECEFARMVVVVSFGAATLRLISGISSTPKLHWEI